MFQAIQVDTSVEPGSQLISDRIIEDNSLVQKPPIHRRV